MSFTQTQTKSRLGSPLAASVVPENYGPLSSSGSRGKGFPTIFKANPKMRQYTWEEVAQHNTESSAWVYIGNQVYDITSFLNRHPGGKEILMLVAGRDISDLFVTYHPFSDKPAEVIGKMLIGEVSTTEFPQFHPDRGFYQECRREIGNYFKTNNINYKNPLPGMWRLALFIGLALLSFYMLMQNSLSFGAKLFFAILFGVNQALPLLHTMHDCSHFSFSNSPTVWKLAGKFTMDVFAGASLYSWFNQHTIGHHVYTNIMGADPDLPVLVKGDIRRITPFQEMSIRYKFQHIYLMVLYGALAIKFRLQDITDTIWSGTNGDIRVNKQTTWEFFGQFCTKTFWVVWRILVPLYVFKVENLWQFWGLFLIAEMTTGYFLAFNFQVSHVSPQAIWPDIQIQMTDEWAQNQIYTSVDYAHKEGNDESGKMAEKLAKSSFFLSAPWAWLMTFLCGALNYQTVHHLFPSISQYYYPDIAPIIKRVCKKYGIRYNYLNNFAEAFGAHVQYLKTMGNEGLDHHHHM